MSSRTCSGCRRGDGALGDEPPGGHDDVANAVVDAVVLAATRMTDDGPVLAANLAPERRRRLLDEREFELLGRGLY